MKRFNFPFERAMDWREKKAEQERLELQRLNAAKARIESRTSDVETAVQDATSALADATCVSAADLRTSAQFLSSLRATARDLQKLHMQCRTDIDQQTTRCVSADRDFQLLSGLREQRLAQWTYEYNRESDDMATEVWQAAHQPGRRK